MPIPTEPTEEELAAAAYEKIVREVQAEFRAMLGDYTGSLVDELIAERRAEAARE